ncbi:MAG TPA: hypothetical protein VGS22_08020 [Thermoanaerobaculia bacterium]|nr:hypothetical protein [Thermoanaerobaculia bacterium]
MKPRETGQFPGTAEHQLGTRGGEIVPTAELVLGAPGRKKLRPGAPLT